MIQESEIIKAGKFLKTHALGGELNVYSDYDAEILTKGYPVIVNRDGIFVPFYVESLRSKGLHGSLVKLEGVDSAVEAMPFVNGLFWLRRKDVAEFLELEEDELENEDDFDGMTLIDRKFGEIGVITYVDYSTPNILLSVRLKGAPDDAEPVLVPLDFDFITAKDEDEKVLEVNFPEEFKTLWGQGEFEY